MMKKRKVKRLKRKLHQYAFFVETDQYTKTKILRLIQKAGYKMKNSDIKRMV